MTAAVTSDFDAVFFGKADQCIDLPVAGVVPHLGNQLVGTAHGFYNTKCNIIVKTNVDELVKSRICPVLSFRA